MPHKLKLSITQPCHENWQQMNPTEQGKFCNACAKEVIDFTSMSDTDVLHYFIKGKRENVCGRLYDEQMNRDIVKPVYTAKKISWYWNYFAMLFLFLFKGNAGKGQVQIKPILLEQAIEKDTMITARLGGITAGVRVESAIDGRVMDEAGKGIAGATVQVKGTNKATLTDANGAYHLSDIGGNDFLKISSVGYCSKEIKASRSGNQVCMLKMAVMGEVVVVGLIAPDYDYTPPADPTHVAVIEVRDNITSQPLKAKITIDNDDEDEPATATTNKKGIYKLRRIKETESYRVTVSAAGYIDSVLNIEGWKLNERKETRYVFLKRENTAAPGQRPVIMGGIRSNVKEPLYIIDGLVAGNDMLKNIQPEAIEKIEVLKGAAALALYGSPAESGVIIITTKKALPAKQLGEGIKDIKQRPGEKQEVVLKVADDFSIAPNPVKKGGFFTISFNSKLNGNFSLQISNAAGVRLQSKKITITQQLNVLQLQTHANWASGIYYLTISDQGSKVLHAGRFIIE
jgi:TonB-dependent SusC/RagA subfamily outer membrane receptor